MPRLLEWFHPAAELASAFVLDPVSLAPDGYVSITAAGFR
jgi:hypothetical protein